MADDVTRRIERDHLRDLLDISSPPERQRITAEMPAVKLDDLLHADDEPEIVIVRTAEASSLLALPHFLALTFGCSIAFALVLCVVAIAR
jgi:hypothetical protein